MKTHIIPFSGGCFSGKTTAMFEVQKILTARGISCLVHEEPIRKLNIKSIDDLRRDPSAYLQMQLDITPPRLQAELNLCSQNNVQVILIDRAAADSLFYPLFYLDKSALKNTELARLAGLLSFINEAAITLYRHVYSKTFFFLPLPFKCEDTCFRPVDIEIVKHVESDMILRLTRGYTSNIATWDMSVDTHLEIANCIIDITKRL